MSFLDLAHRNETSGRWIYSSFFYDEKNNSIIYSAFDVRDKKQIFYKEEDFILTCVYCGDKFTNKHERNLHLKQSHTSLLNTTNTDIRNIVLDELKKGLDSIEEVLDDQIKNINICGHVQCGKSRIIMLLSWLLIYEKNKCPVLFVANMIHSYNQILTRDIPSFNQWLNKNGEYKKILKIQGLRNDKFNPCKKGITLCMGNKSQMTKINQEDSISVIVDESDTFIKHFDPELDTSCSGPLFSMIIQNSPKNFFITATPFANLNQKNVESCSVRMNTITTYRGIDSPLIKKHFIDNIKNDDALADLIMEAIAVCRTDTKYSSLLVNARSTMKGQEKIAKILQKRGIESFVINSEYSRPICRFKSGGGIELMKLMTIQNLYDFFEMSQDGYRCHVLISNRMANRAISFRPNYPKTGGLIGEILIPSRSSHCAYKIQCLRICGNYDEAYPEQHLWISKDDYFEIESENKNIHQVWIPANKTYGPSRLDIENKEIFYTKKHDRNQVDDSKHGSKFSMREKIFDSKDSLFENIKDHYDHFRIMTDKNRITVENISGLNAANAHSASVQKRVRNQVIEYLEKKCKIIVSNKGLIIAWEYLGNRWKQLHNMNNRFYGKNIRYCSKYVGSVNEDYTKIHVVIWKDGYFENDRIEMRTLGDPFHDSKVAFLYQTTENKWKFYNANEDRKCALLTH